MTINRRSVLRKGSIAAIGSLTLAGCTGNGDNGNGNGGNGNGDNGNGNGGNGNGGNGNGNGNGNGGNGGDSGGDEYSLTIGSLFARETSDTQMFFEFAESIEEKTDGRITAEVLPQQIGGGEDHLDATANGTIDMHGQSVATIANAYGPEYGFVATPFIPQDWEHHVKMWETYIEPMEEFNGQLVEDGNQRAIGTGINGVRHVTSNKPIRTPEDIEGVAMRVPQITTWTNVWDAIGADATPVAFDELYQSLETGVVQASEGPISQVFDASLHEVQSHFSLTGHIPTDTTVTINEETWQSFSDDDKELVQTTLGEALEWVNETKRSNEDDLMQQAEEEEGMTIIEDVDRQAFVEGGQSALEEMSEDWIVDYQEAIDLADQ